MKEPQIVIPRLIEQLLVNHGITPQMLADATGCSRPYVSQVLDGKTATDMWLRLVEQFFGTERNYLVYQSEHIDRPLLRWGQDTAGVPALLRVVRDTGISPHRVCEMVLDSL